MECHQSGCKEFRWYPNKGADLFAGGVPCPPFSVAGKQLGENDERDLFPEALRLIREIDPKAVMLENVRGIFDKCFDDYRTRIRTSLEDLGYRVYWELLNASDYSVPQLRPRAILIAIKKEIGNDFSYLQKSEQIVTVGDALHDLLAEKGWKKSKEWKEQASTIAPTIVGGSKKHGGPDLGPTRAKKAWEAFGVDGRGIGNEAPNADFEGMPKLTTRMVARIRRGAH